MSRSTFSVGVDVDSLWHYYRIHGLDETQASDHAWGVGVPRFMSLFDTLGLPATFYCVAEDVERSPSCPMIIKEMSDRGFEIGNHSWHHPYALTTLTHEVATREITEGKRLLEEASQSIVSGFRAPGYHTHRLLHQPLIESGHRYESSAFPCAPYYIAKAMVMGGMRLLGRRSQSILGPPTLLTAPHQPYLAGPESPYRALSNQGELSTPTLTHFPIAVWCGLPLIGTLLALLGPRGARYLGRGVARGMRRGGRHLTIEFHAADLLSLIDDELDPLLRVQPDLRRPVAIKKEAFTTFLSSLAAVADPIRLDRHPLLSAQSSS